jgi:hypothetical protein
MVNISHDLKFSLNILKNLFNQLLKILMNPNFEVIVDSIMTK